MDEGLKQVLPLRAAQGQDDNFRVGGYPALPRVKLRVEDGTPRIGVRRVVPIWECG